MKTIVLTVTYGNRFNLLKQVIDSSIKEGVMKIIVVDNNSDPTSRNALVNYEKELKGKIKVLYLDDNYGSAGGFKRGLEYIHRNEDTDFVWLLDDDNLPNEHSLKNLLKIKQCFGEQKVVLVSYRKILNPKTLRIEHKAHLQKQISEGTILGKPQSLFSRALAKFNGKKNREDDVNFPISRRLNMSYGGMLLPKIVLEEVGYPNEDFYLYADDHEYSYRLEDAGYKFYTCYFSQILDLDVQLGNAGLFNKDQSDVKIYYEIRNHTYLQSKTKTVSYLRLKKYYTIIRNLNLSNDLYFIKNRISLINKAFKDGINGNLGRTLK